MSNENENIPQSHDKEEISDKESYDEDVSDDSWSTASNKENEDGSDKLYMDKNMRVLIEKEKSQSEMLPKGWVEITHSSGMPVYLHRATRICTLAKPYSLGPGSSRYHKIPLSAIPCLSYRRAQDKEVAKRSPMAPKRDISNIRGLHYPTARTEMIQKCYKTYLTPNDVFEYCDGLFKFKTVQVKKFQSWEDRKVYTKDIIEDEASVLADGTKVVISPHQDNKENSSESKLKKEWFINPIGKNYIGILHEYVQQTFHKPPDYKFVMFPNGSRPHMATVTIDEVNYGIGLGRSKKTAKHDAAKATLDIFIPGICDKIKSEVKALKTPAKKQENEDVSILDELKIDDPRISDLCVKLKKPSPFSILRNCLKRTYFGRGKMFYRSKWDSFNKKNELTMTAGDRTTTVICKNKRDGKNRAAQAILQQIHPDAISWGSVMSIYENKSAAAQKKGKKKRN